MVFNMVHQNLTLSILKLLLTRLNKIPVYRNHPYIKLDIRQKESGPDKQPAMKKRDHPVHKYSKMSLRSSVYNSSMIFSPLRASIISSRMFTFQF